MFKWLLCEGWTMRTARIAIVGDAVLSPCHSRNAAPGLHTGIGRDDHGAAPNLLRKRRGTPEGEGSSNSQWRDLFSGRDSLFLWNMTFVSKNMAWLQGEPCSS